MVSAQSNCSLENEEKSCAGMKVQAGPACNPFLDNDTGGNR